MTTTTVYSGGRLGNQIIRNLFISIIAKNNNLKVNYNNQDNYYINQQKLGLELFSGTNDYNTVVILNDNNILEYVNKEIKSNLGFHGNVFFQTKECSNFLYNYIQTEIKSNIESANIYKYRYNNNNDVFIHVRLGDVKTYNPGFIYYDKVLSTLVFEKGYISTDSPDDSIIQQLLEKYPILELIKYDEVNTIHFGSTCRHIILSHGSFSALIGYMSFYSSIYYPEYNINKMFYGDIFDIPGWNKIEYLNK